MMKVEDWKWWRIKKKKAAATGKKPGFVELDEIEPASLTIPSVHLPPNANWVDAGARWALLSVGGLKANSEWRSLSICAGLALGLFWKAQLGDSWLSFKWMMTYFLRLVSAMHHRLKERGWNSEPFLHLLILLWHHLWPIILVPSL